MNRLFIIGYLLMILIKPYCSFSECWDVYELSYFAESEIDGYMVLSFKDSVKCEPVVDAKVEFAKKIYKTDIKGYVKLPISYFESVLDATIPVIVSKNGYCDFRKDIEIQAGTIFDKKFLLSAILPAERARFILQWGQRPRDLDLHLVGKDFHISYRNMKRAEKKANLDRDDVDSFGPETITLNKIIKNNSYDVYVHNYSGESFINNEAEISVYNDNKLDKIIKLPNTNKRAVHILQIKNGMFYYKNNAIRCFPEKNLPRLNSPLQGGN